MFFSAGRRQVKLSTTKTLSQAIMPLRLVFLLALVFAVTAAAAPVSDVRSTKHNLSTTSPNAATRANSETQVCVFCHTPHGATAGVNPLWNRSVATTGYTRYTSSSLDSTIIGAAGFNDQPAGSSVLCLSCHDGQVALGNVNVLNGVSNAKISVSGSINTTMPAGDGVATGFTRHLGKDLTNDHPISVTYNDTLAVRDGELARMSTTGIVQRDTGTSGALIGIRTSGYKPKLPLQSTGTVNGSRGQVQCGTCHDPHLFDSADPNRKFLRLNRLQSNTNPTATFSEANDIMCLACHTKLGTTWVQSAHADKDVANETYSNATEATRRGFITNTTSVANASCLNCHDTHTVSGARRLLREGTTSTATPKSGGNPAQEETCYQCHSSTKIISGTSTSSSNTLTTNLVPDIKTEFARTIRMPQTGTEVHDIGGNFNDTGFVDCTGSTNKCGADMIEERIKLGLGVLGNRHAECTDCHNPHRVRRNSLFYGALGDANSDKRTHDAGGATGNVASGVLRGSWGVEPVYPTFTAASIWPNAPTNFNVKRGDPGGVDPGKGNSYLTREYQLCFKCHSNYAVSGAFPALGGTGKTPSNTNSMSNYTNIAAEMSYGAVDGATLGSLTNTHQCEAGNDTACTPSTTALNSWDTFTTNASSVNHRSWHPAMYPTGRNATERGGSNANFRAPFQASLGLQTMYCSDCHGNSGGGNATTATTGTNSWIQDTGPNPRRTQGPHGSDSNFLLRGTWIPGGTSANTPSSPGLCGNCHVGSVSRTQSGFGNADTSGHSSSEHGKRCGFCHIAVPHGWKNKAFLVNLNCVGEEGGAAAGSNCVSNRTTDQGALTFGPYYVDARLRVRTWQRSGAWTEVSCGSPSASGESWMDGTC